MDTILTKADWLMAQQCVGMAWHTIRTPPAPPDEATRFRMEQGQELHARARQLFPGGALVPGGEVNAAAAVTGQRIRDGAGKLFEATVLASPFVAKADVLTRLDGGWHLLEVKSSFADTKEIKDLVDDLSYTTMVFQRAGLPVKKSSLVLLSRGYRFGDDLARLFDTVDKTGEVENRAAEWAPMTEASVKAVLSDIAPTPALSSACRDCAAFENCLGRGLAHTVLELPSLHHTKLKRFSADEIVDLADVPDAGLNPNQLRAKQSALSNRLVVDSGIREKLAEIAWPCHYLDFETVAAVLPLYPGRGCHEQILTQFSIHHLDRIGGELRHSEYLADEKRDCERELAERLIEALQEKGSIMVYNATFEKTRIKALQGRFPDLERPLETILNRIVDLLPIVRDHVYHPDFRGSFSIKHVLPALVRGVSYDDLTIANGDSAITAFARMARGEIVGDAVERTRQQLLEYCRMDTFAMVRLHDELARLAA